MAALPQAQLLPPTWRHGGSLEVPSPGQRAHPRTFVLYAPLDAVKEGRIYAPVAPPYAPMRAAPALEARARPERLASEERFEEENPAFHRVTTTNMIVKQLGHFLEDNAPAVAQYLGRRATHDDIRWHKMVMGGRRARRLAEEGRGPMPQQLPREDGEAWVTAKYWGIGKDQIQLLYDTWREDPRWSDEDSVRHIVDKFVVPATRDRGLKMGVALSLNQENPLEVNLMISHAWDENATRFFEDVLDEMREHEVAYICFLSNYQGTSEEITAQLGNNIHEGPFTQVINSAAQRMLVVPCEELKKNGEGLYSRLWCIWEMKVAADAGLPIKVVKRRSDSRYLHGDREKDFSRHAKCGNAADQALILQAIRHMPPADNEYQATCLLIIAICFALGPTIFRHALEQPGLFDFLPGRLHKGMFEDYVVCGGMILGLLSGLFIVKAIAKPAWFYVLRKNNQDGFDVLDKIIDGAAKNHYSFRRVDPEHDFLVMFRLFASCCAMLYCREVFRRYRAYGLEPTIFGPTLAEWTDKILLTAFGFGICIWAMWDVNTLGPWTGAHFPSINHQRIVRLVLFTLLLVFRVLGCWLGKVWAIEYKGSLCALGLLVGILIVGNTAHRICMTGVISAMSVTIYRGNENWREIFILCAALDSYVLLPHHGHLNRLCCVTVALGSILFLLFCGSRYPRLDGCGLEANEACQKDVSCFVGF